jgi:hypothetical protein
MFKHKVFDLLKSLTSDEFDRFGDFINSPYFNKSKNLIMIYKHIAPYYPDFIDKNLSKINIYQKLFRSTNYKDSSIRNVLSKLVNAAQAFLVVENLKRDKLSQDNLLLEELNRRKLYELFTKNLKDTEAMVNEFKEVDFDYLLNRYKLERNKFNFSVQYDKIISKHKVYPRIRKLSDAGIYLSIYYITEMIAENINIVVYNEKFNFEEKLPSTISLILDCINYIRIYSTIKGSFECDFILEIYLALLAAFRNLDEENAYYTYKDLVNKYKGKLSHDEISFHYSIMLGCCILKGKLTRNPVDKNTELMNLYHEILNKEYYKNKKTMYLPEDLFRDILFLRIRVKSLDLVKTLIYDFTDKIHFSQRENMYNFSNAFYHFELKNYGKALEHINMIKLEYFIYKYDIKNLLLKVYFELGYYEEALSLIHSYRELLRKDAFFTESRKIKNKNFIKYVRQLIVLKIDNKTKDIDYIKHDIEKSGKIAYKHWLLEKVDQTIMERM